MHNAEKSSHDLHDCLIRHLRQEFPAPAVTIDSLALQLQRLIDGGGDQLPLPGKGNTLERWRMLAAVASHDLGLAKLFEGHTDALAIIDEWSAQECLPPSGLIGMWAAEPPFARVSITDNPSSSGPCAQAPSRQVRLDGRKAWCSGAPVLSHALITAWHGEHQRLVLVELEQPGVTISNEGWEAVGMAATASVDVLFDGARGMLVGPPDGYLQRYGFWHGGAGIAACWFGGARRLVETLQAKGARSDDPHLSAHLGAVDVALASGAAMLRESAQWIDANPGRDAWLVAERTRAKIEQVVEQVIHHCGRGLGAGPYCRDPAFARMVADLPVYVRQSHAEHDLAGIGRYIAAGGAVSEASPDVSPWEL
ncbi:acyl-CoA dehydrogenase family protein [Halomonas sp. HP20-15]|uniref:acyl-CoA dehydrogenase family protein n=1 Tax=Halomonas sp. HP20-15 TaxID=3085901 RepID=UPI0029819E85|nr:acyl-CoA dehydrogenase family protein [Halomonas sp. HP20-15]MDW5377978.1 acyl-CoA dehydrogenase family protein [Halomonas sp. HP20-15]